MKEPSINTRATRETLLARLFAGLSFARCIAVLGVLLVAGTARAQSIDPRSYSNAPIGIDFLLSGVVRSNGGVPSDPALPLTDPKLEVWSGFVGFAHVFELAGQSGNWALIVPYSYLSGDANYLGQHVTREQSGGGDILARVTVNLIGAPALNPKEFASYRQDLIVGASLAVSAPTGAYDDANLVNIGTNRWMIKSELGASKAVGDWILETSGAVTIFTNNDAFSGGHVREQDPIYSLQLHAIYTFRPGLWVSGSVTYYNGGRTTVDGVLADNLQDNWRAGATLSVPLTRAQSVKLSGSNGVSARTGNNFSLLALSWQLLWDAW